MRLFSQRTGLRLGQAGEAVGGVAVSVIDKQEGRSKAQLLAHVGTNQRKRISGERIGCGRAQCVMRVIPGGRKPNRNSHLDLESTPERRALSPTHHFYSIKCNRPLNIRLPTHFEKKKRGIRGITTK